MRVRSLAITGSLAIALCCATQVSAELLSGAFNSVVRDVKRRQCWPDPFQTADRASVRAPFCAMVANGWRRQNMLGEFHFEPQSGQLTEAGRLKVHWILTACPEQHRQIYVHTATTSEETAARVASVQQVAAQLARDDMARMVPVMTTSIADDGWPASRVDAISRKMLSSTPIPRLSETGGVGSGGGNGGSN
ncbi:MAG: hypothetical protein ABFC63_07475 [Thermoguttaceae bacterium]